MSPARQLILLELLKVDVEVEMLVDSSAALSVPFGTCYTAVRPTSALVALRVGTAHSDLLRGVRTLHRIRHLLVVSRFFVFNDIL